MKHGFVKVAAVTPEVRVADVAFNKEQICKMIDETVKEGAKVVVFPELCVTGYTSGDLFAHEVLVDHAKEALLEIAEYTKDKDALIFVGAPVSVNGKLYNTVAALNQGEILGFTTKTFLANHGGSEEMRYFCPGPMAAGEITFAGKKVPFGPQLLFTAEEMDELTVAAEIGEDLMAIMPPSTEAAAKGATIIVNASATASVVNKAAYTNGLIAGHTLRLNAGYVLANAGDGESTTDMVFCGHNVIAENGVLLNQNKGYENGVIYSEIDVKTLCSERRKNTLFVNAEEELDRIAFSIKKEETALTRKIAQNPFIPENESERAEFCEEILTIQAMGLKKRLAHAHAKSAVVGISGGLDSTLAILVTAKAFDMLGLDRSNIHSITMPCFGTTDRTYNNACTMTLKLGATLKEVRIAKAVTQHFEDIGHDMNDHSVTFENAQARERTQVLMDISNQVNGMVIGTGDMSELALGWATYNGDHMSMYGVNGGVPKTMVRHLVRHYADTTEDKELQAVLYDVLDTPVSPELLPPKEGEIAQKTEDLVGPYELHDFFLYNLLRYGYEPSKVYRLAKHAFAGEYDDATIYKWLRTFCWRFFTQQFKRSCLPDGPGVYEVGLSPRGGLKMPSDACVASWMRDLETVASK